MEVTTEGVAVRMRATSGSTRKRTRTGKVFERDAAAWANATLTDGGTMEITDQLAESFVHQIARNAFEGVGPLAPVREVADEALRDADGDGERAIDALIAGHTRLAAVEGFATGLGGFVMLPVALPANVLGFYTIAARLVGAIAHLRGHDLDAADTRMAALVTLTGDQASRLLAKAGVMAPAGKMTRMAVRGLPPSTAGMVNKALGFKLLVGVGEKGLVRLGRAIPFAGGLIGGAVDVTMLRSIARHAREQFPAVAASDDASATTTVSAQQQQASLSSPPTSDDASPLPHGRRA